MRSGGRVVEGARLESEYTPKAYRGFESLPLRHLPRRRSPGPANPFSGLVVMTGSAGSGIRWQVQLRSESAAMRKITAFLATALVLATTSAQAAPRLSGEEKLAREIEGRVAGEPVRCLPFHRIRSSRIIDDTAIVYDAGSTLYVNRPRAGRESLDQWDMLVTRTF